MKFDMSQDQLRRKIEDGFYAWAGREHIEPTEAGKEAYRAGVQWMAEFMGEAVKELERQHRPIYAPRRPKNDITNLWGLIP